MRVLAALGKRVDELAFSLLGQNFLRHAAQRAGAGSRAGWLFERIGFRRCVWVSGFCVRNGHGRLDPGSREQLRNLGLQTAHTSSRLPA